MRRVLRFLVYCLLSLLGLVALCGALFAYFVYTPPPEIPHLSGTLTKGTIEVGGLKADLRDLRAAGAGERSTACGGDARLG